MVNQMPFTKFTKLFYHPSFILYGNILRLYIKLGTSCCGSQHLVHWVNIQLVASLVPFGNLCILLCTLGDPYYEVVWGAMHLTLLSLQLFKCTYVICPTSRYTVGLYDKFINTGVTHWNLFSLIRRNFHICDPFYVSIIYYISSY